MINLIRSEWIKFRSVRSTLITLIVAGAIVVLVAVLTARHLNNETSTTCRPAADAGTVTTTVPVADEDGGITYYGCMPGEVEVVTKPVSHLTGITGGVTFAALLFGVLGVQVIGQEYRFNTIRPTFTAEPRRLKVIAAKLIVVSGACATIAATMLAFCWLVGSVMLDRFEVDGTDRRVLWGTVLFSALWAAAGLGLGAIIRQPIAAILVLVAESLILETLIGGLFDGMIRWMPFNNGLQMTYRADGETDLQSLLSGGIYFAGFCFLLVAIGALLVNRRDA